MTFLHTTPFWEEPTFAVALGITGLGLAGIFALEALRERRAAQRREQPQADQITLHLRARVERFDRSAAQRSMVRLRSRVSGPFGVVFEAENGRRYSTWLPSDYAWYIKLGAWGTLVLRDDHFDDFFLDQE